VNRRGTRVLTHPQLVELVSSSTLNPGSEGSLQHKSTRNVVRGRGKKRSTERYPLVICYRLLLKMTIYSYWKWPFIEFYRYLSLIYLLKLVIVHSYVGLPECINNQVPFNCSEKRGLTLVPKSSHWKPPWTESNLQEKTCVDTRPQKMFLIIITTIIIITFCCALNPHWQIIVDDRQHCLTSPASTAPRGSHLKMLHICISHRIPIKCLFQVGRLWSSCSFKMFAATLTLRRVWLQVAMKIKLMLLPQSTYCS